MTIIIVTRSSVCASVSSSGWRTSSDSASHWTSEDRTARAILFAHYTWQCIGKLPSVARMVASMRMTQRLLSTSECWTHFTDRLLKDMKFSSPKVVMLPVWLQKLLIHSLASKKPTNAQPNGVPSGFSRGMILWGSLDLYPGLLKSIFISAYCLAAAANAKFMLVSVGAYGTYSSHHC